MTPKPSLTASSSRRERAPWLVGIRELYCPEAATRGLTAQQRRDAETRRYHRQEASSNDIFGLLKLNLSDDDLSQPPTLVWPASAANECRAFLRGAARHTGYRDPIDAERSAALQLLANALREYPQYGRGAEYLEQLAGVRARVFQGAHRIDFLETAGAQGQRAALLRGDLPERAAMPEPRRLRVVFRR